MGCGRYSSANRLDVLLDEDDFVFLSNSRTRKCFASLTRILEDMTNPIGRLGMTWKEKSLTIVVGPFTEHQSGDVVEIISNSGTRWIWRVVEGMEALGTCPANRGCSEAISAQNLQNQLHVLLEGFVLRSQTAGQKSHCRFLLDVCTSCAPWCW